MLVSPHRLAWPLEQWATDEPHQKHAAEPLVDRECHRRMIAAEASGVKAQLTADPPAQRHLT